MSDNAETATGDRFAAGRMAERADTLAYLGRRHANAATMASQRPQLCEFAEDRRRQIEALIDELEGGLHVSEVQVAALIEGGKG